MTPPTGKRRAAATVAKSGRRDRRDELLAAAIGVFCDKGFAGASMQDIAKAVGVLKGSLYHYVSSKDELLENVFTAAGDETEQMIEDVEKLDVEPVERLRTFVRAQIDWYLRDVARATVLQREWRFVAGDGREIIREYRGRYEAYVRSLIEACVDAGATDADLDVDHAMRFVLGGVEATPEWFRASGSASVERVGEVYAALTLGAVLRPPD
ncbi:TetR/AcrR family transcriptional regulator [Patulibacter minatonensis]|uniref:TetR/AcrR family transcriptional regulator n=1 Tax=Patulibacter minatonensis TaxID=298163 RepID=UPI000479C2AA|nr:TetR/AcrR family transcriptional regulator [Patulibacter minatonensis]